VERELLAAKIERGTGSVDPNDRDGCSGITLEHFPKDAAPSPETQALNTVDAAWVSNSVWLGLVPCFLDS
jgi:hypothetical protein